MHDILIACATRAEAERGLRLGGDLSAASGARVSLVVARSVPTALHAAAGLDAVGHLSSVLFSHDRRTGVPTFGAQSTAWLDDVRPRVRACWDTDLLAQDVAAHAPSLVIACNHDIEHALVTGTRVPVWHLKSTERSWFTARTIRCAVRGTRALAWARSFASSLNADLEAAPVRLFRNAADLLVIDREESSARRSGQPLVVV